MYYKVLFILHLPPPVHGSSVVGKFIKDSKIINSSINARYINLGTSATVNEIGKKQFIKLSRYFLIIGRVFIQLLTFKPDLCYLAITAKGPAFFKDALIALLIKLFGVKTVYHFHNKGVSTHQDKWVDNLLYKLVFKNSEVILLSEYLYPDIKKYVSKENVYYCPNGIPETDHNQKLKAERSETVQLLFLSNLIESKGIYVLLDALNILKDKKLGFQCTFIGGEGDITANQFQENIEKRELHNVVQYAGKKYGQAKEAAFAKADIFVFPTYYAYECFPLVLLEAMQNALPVISTFEGGIQDIVEDGVTGFLVPQKDVQILSEKLEILIRYPELRQKMGKAGRSKYEKEFILTIFENRLKDILNKILTDQK